MTAPFHTVTDHAVIRIRGADTRTFLDATLSQRVGDLETGTWRAALWLDIHGAPVAMLDVAALPADGGQLLALVPAELATTVIDGLGGRTFLSDVTFDLDETLRVVAVRGGVPSGLADVGDGRVADVDGRLVLGRSDGVDLVVDDAGLSGTLEMLEGVGSRHGTTDDLRRHDIAVGRPRWGVEVAPPHLPEELGLLPTHVHLDKGCYPGQEAVARMWMLGRPRRRLARLRVAGTVTAGSEAGTGRARTLVTSVAGNAALGFVAADAKPGATIDGDGWAAEIVGFVGDEREAVGHQPGVVRRRDRR